MSTDNTRVNSLTIGKYVFAGPVLNKPVFQTVQPTPSQVLKMQETVRTLGELGCAAHILYADECLQCKKMSPEERKQCDKDLIKHFRQFCPNIKKDVTNMEIHVTIDRVLQSYEHRFTKRNLQAVFLVYQNWKKISGASLKSRRTKVWLARGLSMIMNSRYYKDALSSDRRVGGNAGLQI